MERRSEAGLRRGEKKGKYMRELRKGRIEKEKLNEKETGNFGQVKED